jgi:hypothetical protein
MSVVRMARTDDARRIAPAHHGTVPGRRGPIDHRAHLRDPAPRDPAPPAGSHGREGYDSPGGRSRTDHLHDRLGPRPAQRRPPLSSSRARS